MRVDEESLRASFSKFDEDGRGELSLSALRRLVAELGGARESAAYGVDLATLERAEDERVTFFEFARWWEVRSAFGRYDRDHNGTIDLVEFRQLVADLGVDKPGAEVEAHFDALDGDEDGLLTFFEFAQWWRVRNAFERVDADKDGSIDLLEFRALMTELGSAREPAAVEADFNSIDRDEGGLLEFAEFALWWKVRSAFDRTDRDRRGVIDQIEFRHLMGALGSDKDAASLDADFATIEHDEGGLLEFTAFERWWKIRQAFDNHDTDQSGSIDLLEFRKLIGRLALPMTAAEIEAEFDAFDLNENGLLEFAEFARWWRMQRGAMSA